MRVDAGGRSAHPARKATVAPSRPGRPTHRRQHGRGRPHLPRQFRGSALHSRLGRVQAAGPDLARDLHEAVRADDAEFG